MIAGLPKRHCIVAILLIATSLISGIAAAQEVQTPSTTLQPILDALAVNTTATAAQQQLLIDSFAAALDAGFMEPQQALDMIALVDWASLTTVDEIASAAAVIADVLDAFSIGGIGDPVAELEAQLLLLEQQPVFDVIGANPAATADQIQQLLDQLASVFDAAMLTPDEALEMLAFLEWESLESPEDIELAITLLTETVDALLAGTVADPVAALTDAYNAELTPNGIVNAIVKAGATDKIISQVQALVAAGLPPGIVLRVTKDALREGEDPALALAELADAYGDPSDPFMSPGQAANQATGRGTYKYQEQEEEQNTNEGDADDPEKESNRNGPRETGQDKEKGNKGGKKK